MNAEIAELPTATLATAFARLCVGRKWVNKDDAAKHLSDGVEWNHWFLTDIIKPDAPSDTAVIDRAMAAALDASTAVQRIGERMTAAENHTSAISAIFDSDMRKISAKLDRIGDVPQATVDAAVTASVASAFKRFEQTVTGAAVAAVEKSVSVTVAKTVPAIDVFGVSVTDVTGAELLVNVYDDKFSPSIDPHFVWTTPILRHLILSQATGENLWFGGEKGTGKSETARQFAARTGRGYCRINFHKFTTAEDFIGSVGLAGGDTVFVEGDFLKAFTTPASIILLDEITNADPASLATLNGFLEPNSAVNFGGAVRRRAAGVLVFAADNTLTNGDESGRYTGTRTMNSALADRFARVIEFKHMDIDTEIDAVVRHTLCDPDLARIVLTAVNVCREKVKTGDVVDAPSIRQVIAFIRALRVLGVDEAWATAIGNRQPSESAAAIESIKAAYINCNEIIQIVKGQP